MSEVDLINAECSLISHRLMARRLQSDPEMLERARNRLLVQAEKFGDAAFIQEWRDILSSDIEEIRSRMVARDQESYRLRISSPFNTVFGIHFEDESLRRRIWAIAKRLVRLRLNKPDGCNRWLDLHKIEPKTTSIGLVER